MTTISTLYEIYLQHRNIQTDTRRLQKGDLFFALTGEHFNGNRFALQALEQGAAYAVVDEDIDSHNPRLLRVPHVLAALQQLAAYHRSRFDIPFIAITGSNGKTTTKELVHAVLASHYVTYTTAGNLNNHIGIPLTLLRVQPDAQMAVVEMGANHQQEIAGYCTYTQPTHGIITNVGKAHLEGFGGAEGVRKGKGELFDFIRATGGSIFAFADYDYLHSMSQGIGQVYWYGTGQGEVTGYAQDYRSFVEVHFTRGFGLSPITTQLVGAYNLPNILCAVAVGKHFGVPEEKIKSALQAYVPSNSRSQLVEQGSNKIILDAYNANPSSMRVAIENFAAIDAPHKVLLLGSMAELGADTDTEHLQLVNLVGKYRFDHVVLVGPHFKDIPHNHHWFATTTEASQWLQAQQLTDAFILVKGSRSMQMEKIFG